MKQIFLNRQREWMIPEHDKGKSYFYEHINRYLFAAQFVKGKVVLDAGCGSGYGSYIISKNGKAKQIYSIDKCKDAINYAKHNYQLSNINYRVGSILNLKDFKDRSVDIAIAFEVIEHLSDCDRFIKEMKRILKTTGYLIISTPNRSKTITVNKFHFHEFYLQELKDLLKKSFSRLDILIQHYAFLNTIDRPAVTHDIKDISANRIYFASFDKRSFKDSDYFVVLCGNISLPKLSPFAISTNLVNIFNLSSGIATFTNYWLKFKAAFIHGDKMITEKNIQLEILNRMVNQSSFLPELVNYRSRSGIKMNSFRLKTILFTLRIVNLQFKIIAKVIHIFYYLKNKF